MKKTFSNPADDFLDKRLEKDLQRWGLKPNAKGQYVLDAEAKKLLEAMLSNRKPTKK